jgi:protein-export membrane protein SecD
MSKKHTPETGVSRLKVKRRVGLIVLLFLIAGSLSYSQPANWIIDQANNVMGTSFGHINLPFVLGLDLQGGTHLEYEADLSVVPGTEQASALEGVRDVIERRVNAMGVSEPLVQTTRAGENYRVSVELAGVRDINEAINMIGETPILEFKVINEDEPRQLTEEEIVELDQSENEANQKAELFLADVVNNPELFQDKVKEQSEDPAVQENGGDLGFIKDKSEYAKIYEVAKDAEVGQVIASVIRTDNAEVVVKVEEKSETGKEVNARHLLIQWQGAMSAGASTTRSKEEALAYIQEIKKDATPENFEDKVKELSEEPGADQTGGDLGWFGEGVMVESFEDAVFPQEVGTISDPIESDFGYHLIYKIDERGIEDVRVSAMQFTKLTRDDIIPPPEPFKRTELTGKQLERAQLEFNPRSGAAEVGLQFNDEGADLFAEITKNNIGKPVAIYLDGEPISVPTVNSEILGGRAVITGTFSVSEAKLLAQRLQAGALPVPIELIAQQSVGPSLGHTSVNASLVAGMWGFLLVALFMLLMYRIPGLIAILALTVYGSVLFAIFKTIPVTLTLSGIAGLILSVGMAVDANVLIFERLKEELKLKKSYAVAIEEAFRRAWPSIRDGNLTTLISCVVLYWFTSSVIKGFALTLGIGILISMFTAIVITRNLLRFAALPKFTNSFGWLFLKKSEANKNNESQSS